MGGPRSGPDDRIERARALVAEHRPADDREDAARLTVLDALDRLESPFDRGADLTHVTASAIVVGPRGVLLHRHRTLDRWMQPGGHLDPGEEPHDAALRECREETGLEAVHPGGTPRFVHLDVHPASAGHVHLDLRYLVIGPDALPAPPPGESPDVAWVSWEEAAVRADDALAGGLRAARTAVEHGDLVPIEEAPASGRVTG